MQTEDVPDVPGMVERACRTALQEGFATAGDRVVIAAGMPFGAAGNTNLLRIATVAADGNALTEEAG